MTLYRCAMCERRLPASDFYAAKGHARPHSWCKPCYRDRVKVLRDARKQGVRAAPIER